MRRTRAGTALAVGVFCAAVAAWTLTHAAPAFVPGAYYRLRMDLFAATPLAPGDIVFLGDSITEGGEWSELFPGLPVRDRGIGGDTTAGVLARLATVTAARPAAIFLLVGTNDLFANVDPELSLRNYRQILLRIRTETPGTRVFVQALLPRSGAWRERVEAFNRALAGLGAETGARFVDLYPAFLAPDGSLRDEFTFDELHLNGAGYLRWRELLAPHVAAIGARRGGADAH